MPEQLVLPGFTVSSKALCDGCSMPIVTRGTQGGLVLCGWCQREPTLMRGPLEPRHWWNRLMRPHRWELRND